MRVTCPSCLSLYELPPDLVAALSPSGRALRCAECGHVWHEAPDGGFAAPDPQAGFDALMERLVVPAPAFAPEGLAATAGPIGAVGIEPALAAIAHAEPAAAEQDALGLPPVETHIEPLAGEPLVPGVSGFDRALPPLPDAPSGRPPAGRAVWIGWVVSVIAVIGLLVAAWVERAAVMRAAPATAPLYHALGAPTPPPAPPRQAAG